MTKIRHSISATKNQIILINNPVIPEELVDIVQCLFDSVGNYIAEVWPLRLRDLIKQQCKIIADTVNVALEHKCSPDNIKLVVESIEELVVIVYNVTETKPRHITSDIDTKHVNQHIETLVSNNPNFNTEHLYSRGKVVKNQKDNYGYIVRSMQSLRP
jgi:hypothetical protein